MGKMEVGVMMSVGWILDQLTQIRDLGFTNAQIAAPPEDVLEDPANRQALIDDLNALGVEVTTVFAGFSGESYTDVPTVKKTVGYLNPATREERVKETERISDFAAALGVNKVAAHVGFVPEEPEDPDYRPMVNTVGRVADYCNQNGQVYSLETGQETGPALLHFLKDLNRENVKVNFDPANMILYDMGNPIEAIEILGPDIAHVHAKDANPPQASGEWGAEVPLGDGSVGMAEFVAALERAGYCGPLVVEREVGDQDERVEALKHGISVLRSLS